MRLFSGPAVCCLLFFSGSLRFPSFSRDARAWAHLALAVYVGVLLFSTTPAAEAASLARSVRVLVYDESEPVKVGRVDAPSQARLDGAGRLLIDRRPVSGAWLPARALAPRTSAVAPGGVAPIWKVGKRTYRGEIQVRASEGRIQVLNRVRLEDYVASILGSEMSPSWPADALRAQAVASRTYALYHATRRKSDPWDVKATVASQVYRGISAESPETRAATEATLGQVLTYKEEPILAVFHSTSGGRTATAGEVWGEDHPYRRSVDVEEEDDAPHTYWRMSFEEDDFEAILAATGLSVGAVRDLRVVSRTDSGRAQTLRIQGARGVETLHGAALRSLLGALGLRSTLFEVRRLEAGFAFVGSGYGHGVGMSQWGARAMAERGDAYQRILARFYPGARLERRPDAYLASRRQSGPSGKLMTSGPQAQGDRQ